MLKSFLAIAAATAIAVPTTFHATTIPLSHAAVEESHEPLTNTLPPNAPKPSVPVRLSIPSIGLDSAIDPMGVNKKGELSVPSGASDHVGWYAGGAAPGEVGSAVIDAHVFAAFAHLGRLTPGSDIYVKMASGKTLHFVATGVRTYPLKKVSSYTLFERHDTTRLNLITCAGSLTPDHSTYDHRLIVYAVLTPEFQ